MADKTVTVKPSGGDYSSLAAAISGELVANANLVTMAGILHIAISGDWSGAPDTNIAIVSTVGFTTSDAYYLDIYTDYANYYRGKWDTTKYIFKNTVGDDALRLMGDYIKIRGLQIENAKTGDASNVLKVSGQVAINNHIQIINCGVKGSLEAVYNQNGINIDDTDAIVDIYNSVVWNIAIGPTGCKGIHTYGALVKLENVTVSGGYRGVNNGGDNICRAINVLVSGSGNMCFYDYAYLSGTTYNASSDATAPGGVKRLNKTFSFVDAANGDFHLQATDTGALDLGTSGVTLGFTDDVDGQTRSGTWDIGADEYQVSAGGITLPLLRAIEKS